MLHSPAKDPDLTVTVKTVSEHNASTKILENNNFVFTEIVQDEGIRDAGFWTQVLHIKIGAKFAVTASYQS